MDIRPFLYNSPLTSLALMLISTISFSLMNAGIRDVTQELEPMVVVFFRNSFGLLVLSPFFIKNGLKIFCTRQLRLHWLRAGLNILAMAFFYVGLSLTPLAEATALAFTAPLFSVLLAVIFLKEQAGVARALAISVGFAGALLIIRPGLGVINPGSVWVVISAFIWGGTIITIKLLARKDNSMTITAYMALLIAIMSLPIAIMFWQTPTTTQYLYLLFIAVTGTLGQVTLAEALSRAEAHIVMPLDFMRLIWTTILGYLIFNEAPNIFFLVGAAMIFGSVVYLTRQSKK